MKIDFTNDELMWLVSRFGGWMMKWDGIRKRQPNIQGPEKAYQSYKAMFEKFSKAMDEVMPEININLEKAMMLDQAKEIVNGKELICFNCDWVGPISKAEISQDEKQYMCPKCWKELKKIEENENDS